MPLFSGLQERGTPLNEFGSFHGTSFYAFRGSPGRALEALGAPGRPPGVPWGVLGDAFRLPGGPGASPGPPLAVSGGLFGVLGLSWVAFGGALGRLWGAVWGSGAPLEHLSETYHFGRVAIWTDSGPYFPVWAIPHEPFAKPIQNLSFRQGSPPDGLWTTFPYLGTPSQTPCQTYPKPIISVG